MTKERAFFNFIGANIILGFYVFVVEMPNEVAMTFGIMIYIFLNELAKAK